MNTTKGITHTLSTPHLSIGLYPYLPTFIPTSDEIYTHISLDLDIYQNPRVKFTYKTKIENKPSRVKIVK